METPSLAARLMVVTLLVVVACGGDTSTTEAETETTTNSATVMSTTTTSTTPVATTTTTSVAPTTTTTTLAVLDAETVNAVFRSYFDRIAAADYAAAREAASGSAAEYAAFTQHLDLLSPQPDWQFQSGPQTASGPAIALDDGRFGTEAELVYVDGDSRLVVSNPVVALVEGVPQLDEWGVDLGSGIDQPPLSQRLKLIGFTWDIDETSCFDQGMWAYVPGGSDTSETLRIITIGLACSPNGDLTPQVENSHLFSDDGTVDVTAGVFLLQEGRSSVPMGTPTFYLAVFEIPATAASAELKWETPFDRSNVAGTTFPIWTIGPFDFD